MRDIFYAAAMPKTLKRMAATPFARCPGQKSNFPATLFRVPHVRLRREEEDAIQRGMSAPRELPEARSVEIFPRPVRIAPARFRRPMTAAEAFGHLRSDVSHLADEGIDL